MINGSELNTTPINGHVTELTIAQVCDFARSRVQPEVQVDISESVRLAPIDKDTLDVAKAWRKKYLTPKMQNREPGWKWEDEYYKRVRRSSFVSLAIWSNQTLCGLMMGQVSDGRLNATIHFLEGEPEGNPLKGHVVDIATRFIEAVGALVGCQTVSISRPFPELIRYYKAYGYTNELKHCNIVKTLSKQMPMGEPEVDLLQIGQEEN